MRGKLGYSMTGEAVAFNERRAVRRDGDVPRDKAHLRYFLRGVKAHLLRLFLVRNRKADNVRAGDGVLGVGVARLVCADSQQPAAFQINARRHAAAVHIVHHLAVADAQERIDDALLLVAQQRRDAAGVDRCRARR